jgi:nucleoside-diphosphate-sugar epimerase
MRIFVMGASGYIGGAVLEALVRGGHQVTGLVRNTERAAHVAARGGAPVIGDLADPASYRNLARQHDGVVHAALEPNPRGIELERQALHVVLEALREPGLGPRAFVYTSGVWVIGPTAQPATEETPINPGAIAAWRPVHEGLVLDAASDGLRTMVVRPGIVYGGTRGIVGDLLRDAANGLVRVIGSGENHWPAVYERDLGDLYLRLLSRADASGLYHANDEADERVNEIVEAIAAAAPQTPDIRRVPIEEARAKQGAYAEALALDQIVRSPRARALGWAPVRRSIAGNAARLFEEWRAGRQ